MSNPGGMCWNSLHQRVSTGQYFTPMGSDICEKCKCLAGKAVGCFFEKCSQLPECTKYKPVQDTCCEFECLQNDGLSDKTELAVLFSLSTGLVLLLIILILVLCCRRQGIKQLHQEQTMSTKSPSVTEQSTSLSGTISTVRNQQDCLELPPPYTAATVERKAPPNEPPPPYADKEESAV